jgi:hypothetical protein
MANSLTNMPNNPLLEVRALLDRLNPNDETPSPHGRIGSVRMIDAKITKPRVCG